MVEGVTLGCAEWLNYFVEGNYCTTAYGKSAFNRIQTSTSWLDCTGNGWPIYVRYEKKHFLVETNMHMELKGA